MKGSAQEISSQANVLSSLAWICNRHLLRTDCAVRAATALSTQKQCNSAPWPHRASLADRFAMRLQTNQQVSSHARLGPNKRAAQRASGFKGRVSHPCEPKLETAALWLRGDLPTCSRSRLQGRPVGTAPASTAFKLLMPSFVRSDARNFHLGLWIMAPTMDTAQRRFLSAMQSP